MIEHRCATRTRAEHALGADARLGPRQVTGRVGRLQRRARVCRDHAIDVGWRDDLGVLDPQTVCARVLGLRRGKRIEHAADAGIADRVNRDVPAAGDRGLDRRCEHRRLGDP